MMLSPISSLLSVSLIPIDVNFLPPHFIGFGRLPLISADRVRCTFAHMIELALPNFRNTEWDFKLKIFTTITSAFVSQYVFLKVKTSVVRTLPATL